MAFLAGGLLIGAAEQWQIKSVELQLKYQRENGLLPESDLMRHIRERRERWEAWSKDIDARYKLKRPEN